MMYFMRTLQKYKHHLADFWNKTFPRVQAEVTEQFIKNKTSFAPLKISQVNELTASFKSKYYLIRKAIYHKQLYQYRIARGLYPSQSE